MTTIETEPRASAVDLSVLVAGVGKATLAVGELGAGHTGALAFFTNSEGTELVRLDYIGPAGGATRRMTLRSALADTCRTVELPCPLTLSLLLSEGPL